MGKKLLIVTGLIIILGISLLLLFKNRRVDTAKVVTPFEKIKISPVEINTKGDMLIIDKQNYQIVYLAKFNKFLITVLASPFKEIQPQAEVEFLKTLGISESDACKLNVEVNTPAFANPQYSGTAFRLSFCK